MKDRIDLVSPQLEQVAPANRLGTEMADRLTEIANALDDNSILLKRAGMATAHQQTRAMANTLSSLADSISAGEGSLPQYRTVLERASVFDKTVDALNAEWSVRAGGKPTAEFAGVVPSLVETLSGIDLTGFETASGKDIGQVLLRQAERGRVIRKSLPRKTVVKDYAFVQLPVVLVVNRKTDLEGLKRAGFEANLLEGYPIIEDQIMLAVAHSYAEDWDTSIQDKAGEILRTIGKGSGARFALVDEDFRVPKDAPRDFAYFWVVPEAYYGRLMPLIAGYSDWSIAA